MSEYDIKFTDTNKTPLAVQSDTELVGGLDIALFGRGFLEYGEELNENLLHLLENFSCPENSLDSGNPDLSKVNENWLANPTEGQLWFNSSRSRLYQWNGTQWIKITIGSDYAANWGQVAHGLQIPRPVAADGYEFPYSECIWMVSPAGMGGRFDYYYCSTDNVATAQMQYHLVGNGSLLTDGFVNYLIIGIKGGTNSDGDYSQTIQGYIPIVTPSPTVSVTPSTGASPTPTPTPTGVIAPSPTRTASPTPTHSVTPTTTSAVTPTPTPTPTPSHVPPLQVFITDSARGGDYHGALAICYLTEVATVNGYGSTNCNPNIVMCSTGKCAPKSGTYVDGSAGVGAKMGIQIFGGLPPYTVEVGFFVQDTGTPNNGVCCYFGNGPAFLAGNNDPQLGTIHGADSVVFTQTIPINGGSITDLELRCDCGNFSFINSGSFVVRGHSSDGQIFVYTFPYATQRSPYA